MESLKIYLKVQISLSIDFHESLFLIQGNMRNDLSLNTFYVYVADMVS